jgi:hypothetical protein
MRFAKGVQNLKQPHKDAIEAMGFVGLLHMPKTRPCKHIPSQQPKFQYM